MKRRWHPALWWFWAALVVAFIFLTKNRGNSQALALQFTAVVVSLFIAYLKVIPARRRIVRITIYIALSALIFRMAMSIIVGVPMPGRTLFTLPQLQLPRIFVGITIGGPVTSDRLFYSFREVLLFISLIIVIGVANALSSPHRMLRVLPARFYSFGLAITIANTFLPMTANSAKRVALAMRMRGQPNSTRRLAIPVLEEALERSVDLAASLESRGYGGKFRHSRYRPERWTRDESLAISGLVILLAVSFLGSINGLALTFFFGLFAITPLILHAEDAS